ncbi:UNVERIFIED_CONTAM: ABC transporter C family member 3 [Sesamum radiatum]|uniref:ABC transporter C family member 3 n=1 Tax=Sesamum radiatum TaxID=300843 RepID=A0AAW2KIE2_SESRA
MASHLLLNPSLLRLFTGSLHLILLLGTIVSWVCEKIRGNGDEGQKQSVRHTRLLFYRPTLYSCLSISLFNLALCVFYCFYWYTNGRSDEKIVILVDLGVKTVAWFYLSRFFENQLLNVSERKYPIVLRLWWGLFVLVSCYCLAMDILYYKKYQTLSALFWASDIVSLLSTFDSVRTTYPVFNDKLESGRVKSNRVTATMLAKALIYSTRWEIGTLLYVIIFTLASYVGPYLIDDFVQYLNGHQDVPNEGYILVSAFTISKVLQCLAQRQYYLKVQQAGYRARAALVSKIYNKA